MKEVQHYLLFIALVVIARFSSALMFAFAQLLA